MLENLHNQTANAMIAELSRELTNCWRFIERRCEGGGWASYAELERVLREACEAFQARGCTEWVQLIDQTLAERKPTENAHA